MQPGYPGPGQDPNIPNPYGQQPGYGQQPSYGQPPYPTDPYNQQPSSGQPYGQPYGQPTSGQPAPPYAGYGDPSAGYGAPPAGQNNTLGLLSMIFGIASIPLACCYIGLLLGGAAIVLGVIGGQKADRGEANNKGQARAGLICGGIGVGITILLIIIRIAIGTSGILNY